MSTTPRAKLTRKCVDCPAIIPVLGPRKRCVECQDNIYRARNNRKNRRPKQALEG